MEEFSMKRLIWLSVILLSISLSVSLTFAAQPELRVGTDATYEPFETQDKAGKFVGFDMELIQLVASELGMKLKITNISWDGIIPGLTNGNYDCLISAMTITPERKKQIDFSAPYFSTRQAIVVKASNTSIKTPTDLVGKTISVQNGTTGDITFVSKIKNAKIKRFTDNPQALQELLNNGADAAVMDDMVAFNATRKMSGLKVVEIKDAAKEDYGIGVKKGNTKLLAKINQAIANLQKNGKLTALTNKYKASK